MLKSHPPGELKSHRPARSVALSLDRLRATGGALPTSSPLAANTVYHTIAASTSAKPPILSPAILPTLAKVCDLWSPEPSQGLSHRQRYLNLHPVVRLGLEAQLTVNGSLRCALNSRRPRRLHPQRLARGVCAVPRVVTSCNFGPRFHPWDALPLIPPTRMTPRLPASLDAVKLNSALVPRACSPKNLSRRS